MCETFGHVTTIQLAEQSPDRERVTEDVHSDVLPCVEQNGSGRLQQEEAVVRETPHDLACLQPDEGSDGSGGEGDAERVAGNLSHFGDLE